MEQYIRKYLFILGFSLITSSAVNAAELPPKPPVLDQSRQMILVVTDSWNNYQGHLQAYTRKGVNQPWQPVGSGWSVYIGKTGLAWGYPFIKYAGSDPVKKEGDGKSPAGAYTLGAAFGFAATKDPQLRLSYIPITATTICVDDPKSKYYGRIIDSSTVPEKDWNSAEIMIQHDPAYTRGVVVNYNSNGEMPGNGSCVFIHVLSQKSKLGTAGCTAMNAGYLPWIWHWLNPTLQPVLVQLPRTQYKQLQKLWGLPKISKVRVKSTLTS